MSKIKNPFPVMEHMTVKMLREYLKKKTSIIIPVGVTEQHGYHLPLATDSIRAEKMGIMIGEQTGIIVGPTLNQSFSGGSCPGTINISPAVMSLVVSDMLLSLSSQGKEGLSVCVFQNSSITFHFYYDGVQGMRYVHLPKV